MEKERTTFPAPTNPADFFQFITDLTAKVYHTHGTYDSVQFFFDWYTNTLAEYRTNFSGPRFSGADGPFPDVEKAAQYEAATQANTDMYADVAFTGSNLVPFSEEIVCAILCVPPTGPIGDGSPCIQILSSMVPGKLLCEVPLEVSAALSSGTQNELDRMWDGAAAANDGFFLINSHAFDSVIVFVPARTLASVFGTWYDVVTRAITGKLPDTDFYPNANLEFRFLNPVETGVLNPIPTIDETKSEFNEKHAQLYGDNAFDLLMPPLPVGVSDGYVVIELTNIRNVYDQDVSKFMFAMQEAWSSMPTNPLLPYGGGVVKECDATNGIVPCQGVPEDGAMCCNPPIPSYLIHLGKGWGHGFDPSTTPTTGKLQPFKDPHAIANVFTTGSKQSSISNFNAKRIELDADVFSGGAMMRWLVPSAPNSDFEVRKLDGQMCGSPDFMMDPDKECINDSCVESICV